MSTDYRFMDSFLIPVLNNRTVEDSFLKMYNFTRADLEELFNYTLENPVDPSILQYQRCTDELIGFRRGLVSVHGYIAIVICILGIAANIINTLVLTQKEMNSPTNDILSGIAVTDCLVMLEYIPFAFYMYIMEHEPKHAKFTYPWAVFVLFHANFTQVCHTISIGLTVLLALWRYMVIVQQRWSPIWSQREHSLKAMAAVTFLCPLLCIPFFFTFAITEVHYMSLNPNYVVQYSALAQEHEGLLEIMSFWIYSVLIKLFPCAALIYISVKLIRTLYDAQARSMELLNRGPTGQNSHLIDRLNVARGRNCRASVQAKRTTRILLAILLLFLGTELPQGFLALLSGILGKGFFYHCYQNLAELIDFLALINCSVSFILYCAMSSQFRKCFKSLIKRDNARDRPQAPRCTDTTGVTKSLMNPTPQVTML